VRAGDNWRTYDGRALIKKKRRCKMSSCAGGSTLPHTPFRSCSMQGTSDTDGKEMLQQEGGGAYLSSGCETSIIFQFAVAVLAEEDMVYGLRPEA
jgi:hypothetical protein